MTLRIENSRPFRCIANSLEDGCLSRLGTANDKDAKTLDKRSNISCSSLLYFYVPYFLELSVGKRHLSPGCLRWWKMVKNKISAGVAVYCLVMLGQPPE